MMVVKRRSIKLLKVLEYLAAEVELFLPLNKKGAYDVVWRGKHVDSEDYFPSIILRAADKLERRGFAEKINTPEGIVVKITDRGKKQILKFSINNFRPKTGKWDGKWRMVFFDIPTLQNSKRNQLRRYLQMLGMKRMQESVWVSPFDVLSEVKYIREVLEIPHNVKLAEINYLENSAELREIFAV